MKLLLTCAATMLLTGTLQAQTVWRCGPDGRSYSDSPCPGGLAVSVTDRPAAADVQAAKAAAERERALAARMTQQRLQQEQLAANTGPAGFRHEVPAAVKPKATRKPGKTGKSGETGKKHPPAEPGIWRAVAPRTPQSRG